jgi:hypothetical protein
MVPRTARDPNVDRVGSLHALRCHQPLDERRVGAVDHVRCPAEPACLAIIGARLKFSVWEISLRPIQQTLANNEKFKLLPCYTSGERGLEGCRPRMALAERDHEDP